MAQVSRARVLDLLKMQCQIFSTTYNPDQLRLGNKILRQRLKGPQLAKYYPTRGPDLSSLFREFKHLELEGINEKAEDHEEHLAGVRSRNKQAPKKKRTAPSHIELEKAKK